MFFVASGVLWLGYWVFSYSLSQVRGCNAGFLAMGNPFAKSTPTCDPDTGGGGSSGVTVGSVNTTSPLSAKSFKTKAECLAYAAAHEPGSCAQNSDGTYYFRPTATGR